MASAFSWRALAVHEMTKENEAAHSQNTLRIDDDAILTVSLECQSKVCEVLRDTS